MNQPLPPLSHEVTEMIAALCDLFPREIDQSTVNRAVINVQAAIARYAREAVNAARLQADALPPLPYTRHEPWTDAEVESYALAAVAADRAQRAQPQVEPPLYTISKDVEGKVVVTTAQPQVEPCRALLQAVYQDHSIVLSPRLERAIKKALEAHQSTAQTSASPTPALESAPQE